MKSRQYLPEKKCRHVLLTLHICSSVLRATGFFWKLQSRSVVQMLTPTVSYRLLAAVGMNLSMIHVFLVRPMVKRHLNQKRTNRIEPLPQIHWNFIAFEPWSTDVGEDADRGRHHHHCGPTIGAREFPKLWWALDDMPNDVQEGWWSTMERSCFRIWWILGPEVKAIPGIKSWKLPKSTCSTRIDAACDLKSPRCKETPE